MASGEIEAYVEARIVRRLHDEGLVAALPAVTLLGRMTFDMLAPVLPDDLPAQHRVMEVLAEQEWVDISAGDKPETMVVEVEPHLLPRLRRYFNHADRRRGLEAVRRVLEPHLVELAAAAPLDARAVDIIDAALRLLPPSEGAELWQRIERRAIDLNAWDWLTWAAERLAAPDEDRGVPRHPRLQAHLRASHLAGLRHQDVNLVVDPAGWYEVVAAAPEYPRIVAGRWLETRGRLGVLADAASLETSLPAGWDPENLLRAALTDAHRAPVGTEQAVASVVAACQEVLDHRIDWWTPGMSDALLEWSAALPYVSISRVLQSGLHLLMTRVAVLEDRWLDQTVAPALLGDADGLTSLPRGQRWLDWIAPESPQDHARLELLVAAVDREVTGIGGTLGEDASLDTVDGERLLSLQLLQQLYAGRDLTAQLDRLETLVPPPFAPRCAAHHRVPPLFISIARCWTAFCHFERAELLLEREEDKAASARGSDGAALAVRDAVRLERLMLARRARRRVATDPASHAAGAPYVDERIAAHDGDPRLRAATGRTR